MKRIFIILLAGSMSIISCENSGSSTVGSYEREETSSHEVSKEGHDTKEHDAKMEEEHSTNTTADTSHTSVEAGRDGVNVETRKGTGVSVDKNGVSVETRTGTDTTHR